MKRTNVDPKNTKTAAPSPMAPDLAAVINTPPEELRCVAFRRLLPPGLTLRLRRQNTVTDKCFGR